MAPKPSKSKLSPTPKGPKANGKWEEPVNDRSDFFKPEFGVKYRIHLLGVPFGKRIHYIDSVGYVHSDSVWGEGYKRCEERGELDNFIGSDAAMRYIVPIVVYRTDSKGQVTGNPAKAEYSIQLWVMPKTAYQQLYDLFVEWAGELDAQDLLLTTAKKGTMVFVDTITVAAKGALSANPTVKSQIDSEFDSEKYSNTELLDKLLGQTLSLDELKEKMDSKGNGGKGDSGKKSGSKGTANPNSV